MSSTALRVVLNTVFKDCTIDLVGTSVMPMLGAVETETGLLIGPSLWLTVSKYFLLWSSTTFEARGRADATGKIRPKRVQKTRCGFILRVVELDL